MAKMDMAEHGTPSPESSLYCKLLAASSSYAGGGKWNGKGGGGLLFGPGPYFLLLGCSPYLIEIFIEIIVDSLLFLHQYCMETSPPPYPCPISYNAPLTKEFPP